MTPQEISLQNVRRLAGGELSLKARLGYVVLLLVAAAMTVIIVSLWVTEPFLPARTRLAFGAMTVVGVAWMMLASWALATRRMLYARDRVIAGGMAVLFTAVFLAGAVAAVFVTGNAAALGAAFTGVLMLALAVRVWVAARRRFAELSAKRDALAGA